jgi:hypothetical protein
VRRSPTFNIFLGVRLTDTDNRPPKMEILDPGTKAWSGLPPRGMEYWERLDDVIQGEPVEPRDGLQAASRRTGS